MVEIKSLLEFQEAIKQEKVFVFFTTTWSGPCKILDMVLEEVVSECRDVSFYKIDNDRFRSIAKDYHVLNVPFCIYFENGKVVRSQSGLMRKEELMEFIHQE